MPNLIGLNKFFLYSRKSIDVEDKQVLSIEAQLVELRELAKREGLNIVEELIEKQSAKVPGRPIFNGMIEKIEKGEASGILAWHPDRLARNSVDGGRIIYLIDRGMLSALKFNTFWFEPTPQGKFMLSIAFGQSKYYVDSLSENTKRGLRQKVRRGEYPSKAPIGYINDSRVKSIVINKKESLIIKKVFELYSRGIYTLVDISNFLAQKGILTKGKLNFPKDRVKRILKNPFYYGNFNYNGELFEGRHEPIISKKLFDQVAEVMKKRGRPQVKPKVEKPFLGLLRCGECGMMVTGENQTKYYKGTNREVTYCYYHCTKKNKLKKCFQPYIREDKVESQLSSLLTKVSLRKDWANQMLEKLDKEESDLSQSSNDFVKTKETELTEIKIKLQFVLDSFLDQVIDRESYLTKKEELLSKKKSIEELISGFNKNRFSWLEPMREWINEAKDCDKVATDSDKQAKKALALKIFGSNLYLENKKVRGEAQNQWSALGADPTSRTMVRIYELARTYFTKHC